MSMFYEEDADDAESISLKDIEEENSALKRQDAFSQSFVQMFNA